MEEGGKMNETNADLYNCIWMFVVFKYIITFMGKHQRIQGFYKDRPISSNRGVAGGVEAEPVNSFG